MPTNYAIPNQGYYSTRSRTVMQVEHLSLELRVNKVSVHQQIGLVIFC